MTLIYILIAITVVGLLWALLYFSAKRNLAETWERMRQGAINARFQDQEDFNNSIRQLRDNGVPEERIQDISKEWHLRNDPKLPPLGPQEIFTFQDTIVTYEIADPNHLMFVEGQLLKILTANPNAPLKKYEDTLGIRIKNIEKPKPSRKKMGFIGWQ